MLLVATFALETLTVGITGFDLKNLLILDSSFLKFVIVPIPADVVVQPLPIRTNPGTSSGLGTGALNQLL